MSNYLSDVKTNTARRPGRAALGLATAAVLALSACSSDTAAPEPAESAPEETASAPDTSAEPTNEASEAPSDEGSGAPSDEGSEEAPEGGDTAAPDDPEPKSVTLKEGESAELNYFTVTLHSAESEENGLWEAWDVEVCYTKEHPKQNADGTTRVSPDPWSAEVRDGEGPEETKWIPVGDWDQVSERQPTFSEKQLKVGECSRGWLSAKHENPDLLFSGLKYAPEDFKDEAIWKF
ncbi:hypothetical protein [Enemella sp. A6]|uniref:hypothetical protein n=1 Tax=Enemella sp. A6 TaxID=3440152 RepID=UPI003EB9BA26